MNRELDEILVSELDRLYRFAYHRVRDEYKAEDTVQNIVLTAYGAYPRLRDKSRTRAWLWGIARNVIMRTFKPAAEIPADEIAIIDAAGVSYETPENEYIRRCDITRVRRAVSYLAKQYRDVCVLYYLEEKDYNTIAKELDIPLSSVKWRLNQTKSLLREELTKMEKTDYMANGYRKAIPLKLNMGGWVNKWDRAKGNYDNADKALEGLLPQNICIDIAREAKTVPEIAADLGVAADYVEEALEKLVSTQSVKKTANTYLTMFPIWDAESNDDVFGENMRVARTDAAAILDRIYSLSEEIRSVGFYGADKGIDKLILFLIGFVCYSTDHNRFETDKLPFTGDDKAWYILGTTDKDFTSDGGCGINTSGSMFGLTEFYFSQEFTRDNRCERTEEQKAIYALYLGEEVTDAYSLSRLLEQGKIAKDGCGWRITVPVISSDRGDRAELMRVLAPVFEMTNALQKTIHTRSCAAVKKHIPKHIAAQTEFFGSYCAHSVLENALFEELKSRGATITQDMATWFTVK